MHCSYKILILLVNSSIQKIFRIFILPTSTIEFYLLWKEVRNKLYIK